MLSERLLKLQDSFIRLEVIIIILENGSVKMYRSGCHRLCHHVSDVPDRR